MEKKNQPLMTREERISRIKDELIREVRVLAKRLGKAPTSLEFNWARDTKASATVLKYFGSWNQFLIEAGFTVNRVAKYTDEELIAQIQMLEKELDRVPTTAEFDRDLRTANSSTAREHFGSWDNFLLEAGFDKAFLEERTRERLKLQLQMQAEELGRAPYAREFKAASFSVVIKHFGSWNQFLTETGIENRRKDFTMGELISQVKMLANELGRTPTAVEFAQDPRTAALGIVKRTFGSWYQFIVAAKLVENYRNERVVLIRQVQMLAKEFGRFPTAVEFEQDPRTASSRIAREIFGSWNRFIIAAGFKMSPTIGQYTKEDLIIQANMLAREFGRTPSKSEFDDDPRTSSTKSIRKYFGSWSQFLAEINLKPSSIA